MGFIFRRFVCRKRIEWHKSVGQTIMKMLAHIATLMYPHPHPYLYLYLHLVLLLIVVFYTNILCDIVYFYSFFFFVDLPVENESLNSQIIWINEIKAAGESLNGKEFSI